MRRDRVGRGSKNSPASAGPSTTSQLPFVSASRRQCQALQTRIDQEDPRRPRVTDRQVLELATMTVVELRSRSVIPDLELSSILYFLVARRLNFHDLRDEQAYNDAVDEIARNLAPRISTNGVTTWNPFTRSNESGRQVRSRFYAEMLRSGQVEASLHFV